MKSGIFLMVGLLALSTAAIGAQPYSAPNWQRPQAQRDMAAEASAVVKQGMEDLLAFMNAKPRPTDMKLAAFLEEKVVPRFDFRRMAALSMGPAYQRLGEEKAADLQQKIEQHFLASLAKKMAGFEQQQVRFFRPRRAGYNQAVVTVGIANPGTYPARFDFRMRLDKDGWKIYDVAANGHSVVAFYRRHFARQGWGAPAAGGV
jgi:phospholipid transport system substrate-binding protein